MTDGGASLTELGLADQVGVVTGAGRGIGRAISLALGAEGMQMVLSARNVAELDDTASAIEGRGGRAAVVPGDVTSEADMNRLMGAAVERFGRLDFVLLNAGISAADSPLESLPLESWQRCVDTNLTGVFLGIRAAIPHLRDSGGGKIIGVGSGSSLHSPARRAPYSATKAALTALLRTASRELRPFNIAVNELQPGPTATAMHGVTKLDPDASDIVGHPLTTRENGDWFKAPQIVAELALFVARLPNNGPTGQVFALNSFR